MTMYRKKTGEPFSAQQWDPAKVPYPAGVEYESGKEFATLRSPTGSDLGPIYPGDWVVDIWGGRSRQAVADEAFKDQFEPVPDLATLKPEFVLDVTNLIGNNNGAIRNGRVNFHVRGLRGDEGENESVVSIAVETNQSAYYPESGRIIVGTPKTSPLLDGHLANIAQFCGSPDAVEQFALVLMRAVALAREAIARGR